jgi:hypothetical protein
MAECGRNYWRLRDADGYITNAIIRFYATL